MSQRGHMSTWCHRCNILIHESHGIELDIICHELHFTSRSYLLLFSAVLGLIINYNLSVIFSPNYIIVSYLRNMRYLWSMIWCQARGLMIDLIWLWNLTILVSLWTCSSPSILILALHGHIDWHFLFVGSLLFLLLLLSPIVSVINLSSLLSMWFIDFKAKLLLVSMHHLLACWICGHVMLLQMILLFKKQYILICRQNISRVRQRIIQAVLIVRLLLILSSWFQDVLNLCFQLLLLLHLLIFLCLFFFLFLSLVFLLYCLIDDFSFLAKIVYSSK